MKLKKRTNYLGSMLMGLMVGLVITPALARADLEAPDPGGGPIVCANDTNPCSGGSVKIGEGCGGGCAGVSGNACCAYETWKCVGSSTTFKKRVCHYDKPYCSWFSTPAPDGHYECHIANLPKPVDPPNPG
ncbi:MAG: hypothetical protein CBB60_005705 [Armatimonadetes bacterium Cent15-Ar3]|nr:MAG: hypothetical protein CBB60_005705 [Armatimonadetes bacterium Cent15-Ar3]